MTTFTAHYTDHDGTYTQVCGDTLAEVAHGLLACKPEYSGDESVTVWATETE